MDPRQEPVVADLTVEDTVARLREALASGDRAGVLLAADRVDDQDAEAIFEAIDASETRALFDLIGNEAFADLIVRLNDEHAADVLELIPASDAADVLEELDPDDATDIFGELEPEHSGVILVQMEPAEAQELQELLAYPPETAGGLMTPAFVSIAPTLRADQAVVALRKVAEEAETVNYVYVTDPDDHLLGVLSLHRLVLTTPDSLVKDLMYTRPITVRATEDQEAAARVLVENDLLALPVVDDQNRILGIITVDDITEVLEREVTEDIERIGGSAPLSEPYLRAKPTLLYRKRIVWLFVLFMAQFLTVSIISRYDSLLAQMTVLSFFIPILIGTGGNIGSQTVTTIVRALAIGEIGPQHTIRVLLKEASTGLMLGLTMAALMFIRALLTNGADSQVALVVAVTVFSIGLWAAPVGSILPIVLNRFRVDPAVVSAPFISCLVDTTGLIIYFTVAKLVLDVV
ncbi:MAG: magnesium transporter [Thermomicrobiales bacterium]|nr:magnesium transporter [Thermomicrobiales bacterium]